MYWYCGRGLRSAFEILGHLPRAYYYKILCLIISFFDLPLLIYLNLSQGKDMMVSLGLFQFYDLWLSSWKCSEGPLLDADTLGQSEERGKAEVVSIFFKLCHGSHIQGSNKTYTYNLKDNNAQKTCIAHIQVREIFASPLETLPSPIHNNPLLESPFPICTETITILTWWQSLSLSLKIICHIRNYPAP